MKLTTTIQRKSGSYVMIDTCFTLDHGYETMVFASDENGNVTDWTDLDVKRYPNASVASRGHTDMCLKWERL